MVEYQKTILGGIVAKNVKLQVFLEPKMFLEMVTEARARNVTARTDSGLVRKIIDSFLNDLPMKDIQIERLKAGLVQKTSVIEELRAEVADLKTKKVK